MTALAIRSGLIAEAEDRVELLRDRSGVYGIGLTQASGSRQLELPAERIEYIVRPDRLALAQPRRGSQPVLQPIPRLRFFKRSTEDLMADALLTALLARAGISRFATRGAQAWWSDDPNEQAANRRRWHAYRRQAVCIVNSLVRQALAAGNQDALRAARRFSEHQRWRIYLATTNSPRMFQLADTFPLLLDMITSAPDELRDEATRLVEAGARLKMIADRMRVPMVLRRVAPGVTWLARHVLADRTRHSLSNTMAPLVAAFMPAGTRAQRRWLWALYHASQIGGPYLEWVARHGGELGARVEQIRAQVHDIGDWVAASYAASVPAHLHQAILHHHGLGLPIGGTRPHCITRQFSADMSVRTVRELAAEWHEAVALAAPESGVELPPPWRDVATVDDLEIVPLATALEICAEGRAMHHCVRSYIPKVAAGECYIFSARRGGQRIATIEVQRQSDGVVRIIQMRGPCNALVAKATQHVLRRWCAQRNAWRPPAPAPEPDRSNIFWLAPGDADDFEGIPF
jgi:hypothetical protein